MAIAITLNDIKIDDWAVDVESRNVTIHYKRLRDDGSVYDDAYAVFWETIPDNGGEEIPSNWYQLPASHVAAIVSLTQDARIALGSLVGEDLT